MGYYVTTFDSKMIHKEYTDVVVVGCGIAGLYTALMLPKEVNVRILAKNSHENSNSYLAQGGISAVIKKEDTAKSHFIDTMKCGREYNDPQAVWILVKEAEYNIRKLEELGVVFDKNDQGGYLLGREGAHSTNRILRTGDYTGKSIIERLYIEASQRDNIKIQEDVFVIDVIRRDERCIGVIVENPKGRFIVYANNVVLATGGIGRIFERTTNAEGIQGDGIAMVLRAGGLVKDMSLVQFHPTAFFDCNKKIQQSFLISEAVRGEGATLRNIEGEAFMEKIHPMGDLAARDIVSTAIMQQIRKQHTPYVYLDVTMHDKRMLKKRFPTIYRYCKNQEIDMSNEWIPVSPTMHYFMGGILVDLYGRTSIEGLYACGECACTGVHGKNRLTSNSLLEAIVFGNRVAADITRCGMKHIKSNICETIIYKQGCYDILLDDQYEKLPKWMMEYFGAQRDSVKLEYLRK